MTGTQALVQSVEVFQHELGALLKQWAASLARLEIDARSPQGLLDRLVLPTRSHASRILLCQRVVEAFPEVLSRATDPTVQASARKRLREIAVALSVTHEGLLKPLTDLAFEAASHRTLICKADRFDVSGVSVLAAASLSNLMLLLQHIPSSGAWRDDERFVAIGMHLDLLMEQTDGWRPGDLWFLDLAARTVRTACAAVRKSASQAKASMEGQSGLSSGASAGTDASFPAGSLLADLVPRFNTCSLLYKLLEADQLEAETAQRSQYQLWPGLEVVVSDPGAESLRRLIIGELARRIVADKVGLARGAFFRFLQALLRLESLPGTLHARTIIAGLLWEILEQDEQILQKLLERPKVSPILVAAVAAVEEIDRLEVPTELEGERRRVVEITVCLRSYKQYHALLVLQKMPNPLAGSAVARTT